MGVVILFPGADRRRRTTTRSHLVQPGSPAASQHCELRELRRIFGLPLEGLLEVGPDGRALRLMDVECRRA